MACRSVPGLAARQLHKQVVSSSCNVCSDTQWSCRDMQCVHYVNTMLELQYRTFSGTIHKWPEPPLLLLSSENLGAATIREVILGICHYQLLYRPLAAAMYNVSMAEYTVNHLYCILTIVLTVPILYNSIHSYRKHVDQDWELYNAECGGQARSYQ